jgi:hypothetical protein
VKRYYARAGSILLAVIALWLALVAAAGATPSAVARIDLTSRLLWARTYDGQSHLDDVAQDVALGPGGSVYVLGTADDIYRTVTVQQPYITLTRYSAAGKLLWRRSYGQESTALVETAAALAVNAVGDVFVIGKQGANVMMTRVLVLRFDKLGKFRWARIFGSASAGGTSGIAVCVDTRGGCYALGNSWTADAKDQHVLLANYNAAGSRRWLRSWDNPLYEYSDNGRSLTASPLGGVVVGGSTFKSADYKSDLAILRYDAAGTRRWSRTFAAGESVGGLAHGLAVARDGSVYAAGLASIGGIDKAIVVKYSAGGRVKWSRGYWGTKPACSFEGALTLDGGGNVLLGATTSSPASGLGWAVMKLSPTGKRLWLRELDDPGASDEAVRAIKADAYGIVYVAGRMGVAGAGDVLAAKFGPLGKRLWATAYDGPAGLDDDAAALAVRTGVGVYVAGWLSTPASKHDVLLVKFKP